jgi:hypothetical protein
MQTLFNKYEIELFQKIMDTCLRKYTSYSVPLAECINMGREIDSKINLETAEAFIWRMMDIKYLAKYMFGVSLDSIGVD